jgi:tripartite-type tricarboxylate transporter receptor subunit TctC
MRTRTIVTVATLMMQVWAVVAAQEFPSKPIRMINPFAPGGPVDVIGRLVAAKLPEAWGQPIVVDNRPSAGGAIAGELVARARPDGYTLLITSTTFAINATLYPKLPYDTGKDFAAVVLIGSSPGVVTVHPSLQVASIRELIALAKRQPRELNYASAGNGTPGHLGMEILKKQAGIEVVHVPYKGAAPAINDALGGRVQVASSNISAVLPHVKAGRLRALGVTSLQRWPTIPDVPTIAEEGFPGYEAINWYALFAPVRTPAPVTAKINAEVSRMIESPEIRERLGSLGLAPAARMSPAEFSTFFHSELVKWGLAVKASGTRPD